jgi:Uma2 family endonuclease
MSSRTLQPPTARRATLDDLMKADGKAELIGGRIVHQMPTGRKPNRIAGRIYKNLDDYAETRGVGSAYTDNLGYTVPELPSGRESFSPDASYYDGPLSADDMDFIAGPPTFAAEVRSKTDYGPAAEREMAEKRADYFLAGTKVVWDVDPQAECVRVYRADHRDQPSIFHKGDHADAEPAVPGWRMPVDRIFA